MKQPVDVVIMGQMLTVASDDGPEHVRAVARFVDDQMRAMTAEGRAVATIDVALLAALNIASKYQKLKREHQELTETIDRLSRRLLAEIPG
ncbi:MAG: cell division protein ZapA [Deltaproteobacteria bacterium]|nr:cell division protein ZapA [Deltaproteobacteria bacterium]MBI3389519.1 cell division protein ZapA [Deltaproteobacteria bacterium]